MRSIHFRVSDEIDRNSIESVFENGLLTLTLPKVKATQPKSIPINVE